jgi:hypothetical protein
MTDEQIALARRAVACKGWRWMAGMVAIHPNVSVSRVLFGQGYSFVGAHRRELKTKSPSWWQGWSGQVQHSQYGYAGFEHCTPIPDLEDPATLGCLLALVREVWGKPAVSMFWGDYWQVVYTSDVEDGCAGHQHMGDGDTEAEALVASLEEAP